ncbi:MAG TPA: cytochrome P450 [Stellaceae bacterium]|jgi:cytochrome P450|nr:cytochrome P450 [Stellaceae bacterium]
MSGAVPAMPPRPARPLSTVGLIRVALANSLAACDAELFEEPVVARRYVWGRFFSVSDPDGIRRVLQDNVDNYPRIGPIRRVFAFASGTGMLSAEGEVWRRHRRALNPTLDPRAVAADVPVIAELAGTLCDLLAKVPRGEAINIGETFAHLVTAATGRVFAAAEREIDPALYRLGQYPGRYRLGDFAGWRRNPATAEALALLPLIDRLIEARRRRDYRGRHDLLWRLAHCGLDAEELHDEVLTLGATAATPLRVFPWFWYLLALHPAAEARLHREIADVLGDRPPQAEDLPRLGFLRQAIDETLRLYPPAPTMFRTALADDVVCGRRVPRGATVAVMPFVVHRHRRLWEAPDSFDPGRFAPERAATRPRYAYLPFAIGPHVCIGAALALAEIAVAVAVTARRFRFRLAPGRPVEPIAWTNLHPKGGIWMTVEPR